MLYVRICTHSSCQKELRFLVGIVHVEARDCMFWLLKIVLGMKSAHTHAFYKGLNSDGLKILSCEFCWEQWTFNVGTDGVACSPSNPASPRLLWRGLCIPRKRSSVLICRVLTEHAFRLLQYSPFENNFKNFLQKFISFLLFWLMEGKGLWGQIVPIYRCVIPSKTSRIRVLWHNRMPLFPTFISFKGQDGSFCPTSGKLQR